MFEGTIGVILSVVNLNSLVSEEASSEFVTINNSEYTLINLKVLSKVQISPLVKVRRAGRFGNQMAFEENALGNSRVSNSGLDDVNSVILKVVVDDAFPDAIVLVGVFNHRFLEVGFKF